MATGFQSLETAVEAMRRGACDYITKPITDLENDLLRFVVRAVERRRLRLCNRRLSHGLQHALEQLGGVRGEWSRHLETLDALEAFGRRSLTAKGVADLVGVAAEVLPSLTTFRAATLRLEGTAAEPVVLAIGEEEVGAHAAPKQAEPGQGSRWIEGKEHDRKVLAFPLTCPAGDAMDPIPGWLIVEPFPESPLRMVDRLVLRTFCDQWILSVAACCGKLPRTDEQDEIPPQTEDSQTR